MLSEHEQVYFRDILTSILAIEEFVSCKDFNNYLSERMMRSAVEREILIISEAALRLKETAPMLCPEIPWHEIRAVGNRIRHAYDYVDAELIWKTITDDLPPLKAAVEAALATAKDRL